MTTAVRQGDLKTIADLIEERLHAELPENLPLRIRCAYKQGNLIVLGEHTPEVKLDLPSTFKAIQQAILALVGYVPGQLRLYLRVKGQKNPYAYHALKTPQPLGAVMDPEGGEPVLLLDRPPHSAPNPRETAPPISEEARQAMDLAAAAFPLNPFDAPPPEEAFEEQLELSPERQRQRKRPTQKQRQRKPQRQRKSQNQPSSWLLPFSACAAIALVLGSATFYALSRPCAIGTCQEIVTANELTQDSAELLQAAQYQQQIQAARAQLTSASQLLTGIPLWSKDYGTAQRLLRRNRNLTAGLDEMVIALDSALSAVAQGKNPPHPVTVWEPVASNWQQAIALMESVPPDSPVYPLALEKLPTYRANLTEIQGRIQAEKTGREQMQAILSVAKVAIARSGVAQSVESWETIYASWEQVIQQLEALPRGTMAHQEASQLLPSYRSQLELSRDRKTKEKIATEAYEEAILAADRAENSTLNNQWSQAVDQWNQAVASAEQVPTGTYYYPKTAASLQEFKAEREVAQEELKKANLIAKTRADLNNTCQGNPKVCEYTLTDSVISVWLSADYIRKIQQTATIATTNRDPKVRQGLDLHVKTLRTALEAIADNAQLPLELYDPYGAFIGRHTPN
ncbi:hypothetical protein J0895_16960 [Phormidium pseudopriestleyi FRX01]|uniref:Uncharacterized protein n=1 Tax=Phormidium pseudopriestleyi FRX01 TaxID=1759528 RepID=A0ABS3FUH1_9CYAN|nr:hypothetical protein [Phormidium pseudopriestleyi]MBO0350751.1 hypothetical protein [Phormidium pseudopriestleyi FRX01]